MTLIEKYISGETKSVYDKIIELKEKSFDPVIFEDVDAVLTETFKRVSSNLEIIYTNLNGINYNFKKDCKYDFERPLIKPHRNVEDLLKQLENTLRDSGHIPLSLKYFYRIVGACNFAWDYKSKEYIPREGGDPLQIAPLNDLLTEVISDYDELKELGLSADYLNKDNISGGPQYSIEITDTPCIDSKFLNEEHNTTFIDYLRIAFDNCGFSRASILSRTPEFMKFYNQTKPLLIEI